MTSFPTNLLIALPAGLAMLAVIVTFLLRRPSKAIAAFEDSPAPEDLQADPFHFDGEPVIALIDENGQESLWAIVDILSIEGTDYALLLPLGDEASDEVMGLRFDDSDPENPTLLPITEDEVEKISEHLRSLGDTVLELD